MPMDYPTAKKLLRLDRLERQAEAYRDLGRERGDWKRMRRAANLQMAAYNASNAIVMGSVRPYRDY